MKRTAVFFALLMGVQVLGSSLTYAGGMKNGSYYPGGEAGEEKNEFFQAIDNAWSSLFPAEKVYQAPKVGTIGGKEPNAPDPFKCSGGYRWRHDGPVVRKEFCD